LLELCVADHTLVAEIRQLGDLVCGAGTVRVYGALDVLAKGRVLSLGVLNSVPLHLSAASDEVHEDAEVRQEDDEYCPQRFAPAGEVLAAKDVAENDDQ
jgi:hypothetical protein